MYSKKLTYLFLVLFFIACSSTPKSAQSLGVSETCTAPAAGAYASTQPGLICAPDPAVSANWVWQPLLPGQCGSTSDCPRPYNYCCAYQDSTLECSKTITVPASGTTAATTTTTYFNNQCVTHLTPITDTTSQRIWFATDPIQPGAANTTSATPYIYNIMGKGRASLNDWCMNQAQQSNIPRMRKVSAWTAMLPASGDSATTITAIQTLYSTKPPIFTDPNKNNYVSTASAPGSGSVHSITDKNGVPNPVGAKWSAWSGFSEQYCSRVVVPSLANPPSNPNGSACNADYIACNGICVTSCTTAAGICAAALAGACTATLFGYPVCLATGEATCAAAGAVCVATCPAGCLDVGNRCNNSCNGVNQRPDLCGAYGPYADNGTGPGTGSLYDNYNNNCGYTGIGTLENKYTAGSNAWSSSQTPDHYGVLVLLPDSTTENPCSGTGFDFSTDCGNGTHYNANGAQSKPIICVANTDS